jgi:hypothetical protein
MTSSSMQMLENARKLVENHGPTLFNKLYSMKTQLLTMPQRDLYLKDGEWSKLRHKLEKKFPVVPDMGKVCLRCMSSKSSINIAAVFNSRQIRFLVVNNFCLTLRTSWQSWPHASSCVPASLSF